MNERAKRSSHKRTIQVENIHKEYPLLSGHNCKCVETFARCSFAQPLPVAERQVHLPDFLFRLD